MSTHPYLGAHMSIAGGLHLALEEAARHRSGAVQLFTKTSNQWAARPLTEEAIRIFKETDARLGPFSMAAHSSYLLNFGTADEALWQRSIDAFVIELERCEALGIPRLVFHPGAHMGTGEQEGLRRLRHGASPGDRAHRRLSRPSGDRVDRGAGDLSRATS